MRGLRFADTGEAGKRDELRSSADRGQRLVEAVQQGRAASEEGIAWEWDVPHREGIG